MHERLVALLFYRTIKEALDSCGINKLVITRGADGNLEVDVDVDQGSENYGHTNSSEREPGHDCK